MSFFSDIFFKIDPGPCETTGCVSKVTRAVTAHLQAYFLNIRWTQKLIYWTVVGL